jgi:hypothetical protein
VVVVVVVVVEAVYSATQSTYVDWADVGQAEPEEHQVCWVKSRVIGWLGISDGVDIVAQT